MSANVGLTTPRGSGTSGYVQRNLSTLKPRDAGFGAPYPPKDHLPPKQRKPDKDILEHDRRREIEVKVLELQDKLEDEGDLDEEAVERECGKLRSKLEAEMERGGKNSHGGGRGLKIHQVHELAEVKIRESERLRRALGLRDGDVNVDGEAGGNEHPMARQERRKREEENRREVERNELEQREKNRELQKEVEAKEMRERERERKRDRSRERRRRDVSSSRSRSRSPSRDRDRERDMDRRRR